MQASIRKQVKRGAVMTRSQALRSATLFILDFVQAALIVTIGIIMLALGTGVWPVVVAMREGQCIGVFENYDVAKAFVTDADEYRPVYADWRYWRTPGASRP